MSEQPGGYTLMHAVHEETGLPVYLHVECAEELGLSIGHTIMSLLIMEEETGISSEKMIEDIKRTVVKQLCEFSFHMAKQEGMPNTNKRAYFAVANGLLASFLEGEIEKFFDNLEPHCTCGHQYESHGEDTDADKGTVH